MRRSTRRSVAFWLLVLFAAKAVAAFPVAPLILNAVRVGSGSYVVPVASSAGVSASWSALATGIATTLGAGIGYLSVKDGNNNELRVPVSSSPGQAIPAPSAPATVAQQSLYTASHPCGGGVTMGPMEGEALCFAWAAEFGCGGGAPVTVDHWSPPRCWYQGSGGLGFGDFTFHSTGCPSGYVVSGGNCTLLSARLAQIDSKLDMQRSATTYSQFDDADPASTFPYTLTNSNQTLNVAGTDAFNNPVAITISATPNGMQLTVAVQTTDSQNNTQVTQKTVNLNLEGTPTSQTQTTLPGQQLTLDPVTGTATVTQVGSATPPATVQENPCVPGGADQRNCEATQQEIKRALTDTPEGDKPQDPTPKSQSEFAAVLPNLGLAGWSLPAHSSVCPVVALDLTATFGEGWAWTFDYHCVLMDDIQDDVAPWWQLVWVLAALFLVLGA